MPDVDLTVIGGGIVGCAVASRAAASGLVTVLLERGPRLGGGTTSRNSEVVHGGMYYPTGSLKATCCVEGRRALQAFCVENDVGYRECGKLIVAVDEPEIGALEALLARGQANGVEDLRLVGADELTALEPEVKGVAALLSPRTAIVDAEGCVRAYATQASSHGAQLMTGAEVTGLDKVAGSWRVVVTPPAGSGREGWTHDSRWVVNAAGLYADRVAVLAGIDPQARDWQLRWVKGSYVTIDSRPHGRVTRLVYPLPPRDGSSLGAHLCLDLAGQLRLGPDVEPLAIGADEDYTVDPARTGSFYAGASRFLPFLEPGDLSPDYCGLRPRRTLWWRDGFADFVIEPEDGELAGLINLVGIESPGLMGAPAIARRVVEWLTL